MIIEMVATLGFIAGTIMCVVSWLRFDHTDTGGRLYIVGVLLMIIALLFGIMADDNSIEYDKVCIEGTTYLEHNGIITVQFIDNNTVSCK